MPKIPPQIEAVVKKIRYSFVTTSSKAGIPHIAVAEGLTVLPGSESMAFKSWFCVKSLENLAENNKIAVAVYDSDKRVGYQILGTVMSKEVEAVLDGYAPAVEKGEAQFPQEEFKLKIKVNEVLELHSGVHSDKNIL
ncbi:MAG TPA: pyridoxamine 5'-phosphate oxidase family protein [Candidatus Brocadiia bacterium]|nr:pyridoxamine 5'-phosphate oxidase family protein [Planctomycetota bacterium]MBI4008051.1 pyridoxamine 5'-phosphate oxidase family protein [Planctomycetota bacterium]MDO8093153.1 pyridoxamine 5'-phosphate oxidase family protein [Candidatus Brocadiales bacterium]